MKVLVIFEQTDEPIIKAIVEMTSKDYIFFKDAGDYIINYSEYDAVKVLAVDAIYSALLEANLDENELFELSENEKKWYGKFSDSIIETISDIKDVDHFIYCGLH